MSVPGCVQTYRVEPPVVGPGWYLTVIDAERGTAELVPTPFRVWPDGFYVPGGATITSVNTMR